MEKNISEQLAVSIVCSLIVPEGQLKELALKADKTDRTISQVIQDAILAYLDTPANQSLEAMSKGFSLD